MVWGFLDSFLGVFLKGKLSSARFPPLPLNRSCDLCILSLACHRSCKLVPGNLSLLSLSKIVCITVHTVIWQNACLFIHTLGEQTQLSLKHYNGYKEFYLTGQNVVILCINDKEHYRSWNVVGVLLSNTLHIWLMLDLHSQRPTVA